MHGCTSKLHSKIVARIPRLVMYYDVLCIYILLHSKHNHMYVYIYIYIHDQRGVFLGKTTGNHGESIMFALNLVLPCKLSLTNANSRI